MRKIILIIVAVFSSLFSATTFSTANSSKGKYKNSKLRQAPVSKQEVMNNVDFFIDSNLLSDTSISDIVPVFTNKQYQEKLEKIPSLIALDYNSYVQRYIDVYAYKRRDMLCKVSKLSEYYFPIFEKVFEEKGLPKELKYLAIVESALNPYARSRVGATGIWQFMRTTGKGYGLNANNYVEDRQDPLKSTYAAAEYFTNMYKRYGDWLLVIAAYNCGPGNVNRAISRSGGQRNFWAIRNYLPAETRGYVPAFIAATYIMTYASDHNILPLETNIEFSTDTLQINKSLSFKQIADFTGISEDHLKFYNPIYKIQFVPANLDNPLPFVFPKSKNLEFTALLDSNLQFENTANPIILVSETNIDKPSNASSNKGLKIHKVRRGENLGLISNKYNIDLKKLKKINNLKSNNIYPGQLLKIREINLNKTTTSIEQIKEQQEKKSTAQNLKVIYHKVQSGDTLWNIAQRYEGITIADLIAVNKIKNSKSLKIGMVLKVTKA